MKIFDFNIHLPVPVPGNVDATVHRDRNLDFAGIREGLRANQPILNRLEGFNALLFNERIFEMGSEALDQLDAGKNAVFTTLLDFRRYDLIDYMDCALQSGIRAIMFNSYWQQISREDFVPVLKACKYAQQHNLVICIDGSFGTARMYDYDNLGLACYIAQFVESVPIVIVHSGGRRILEFMLLALDRKNIWLDTSFSLPFYQSSSLEQDYAFAYKKIGLDRIIFGSDIPYVDFDTMLQVHEEFFERHSFSGRDIERIMYFNALDLFQLN